MSAILNAIAKGFSSSSVLNQVVKKFPKLAKEVGKAQLYGYTPRTILRHLEGRKHEEGKYLTEREQQLEQDKVKDRKAALSAVSALGVAGAVAGGIGSLMKNKPILPTQPNVSLGGNPPSPKPSPITPGQQGIIDKVPSAKDVELIGSEPFKDLVKPSESIKSEFPQLQEFVDKSIASGKTPQEIYENLKKSKFLSPLVHRIEEKERKSFLENIKGSNTKDDLSSLKTAWQGADPARKLYEGIFDSLKNGKDTFAGIKDPLIQRAKPYFDKGMINSAEDLRKFVNQGPDSLSSQKTPIVGSEIISPFGAGSIEHIKGDKAVINIDGKKRSVPVEELEPPSEDAIHAVTKMLGIPEKDLSSNVSLFFYDPEVSDLFVQFHSGDFYRYKDLPKEIVENLASKNAIPLTKGENIYGEWSPDDKESLGAALYRYVLEDPKWKRAAKGQEANSMYKKLSPLYDYWKPLRKKGKK